ncbi:DMT family transporter [Mesobacterium sp. TK19101]|uniref:DMT family transporter n=1 Tax=Mesobacterium hydrothermale TaxID=3111907 RepID=A0ABU6HCR5_9RHOB|nr:DMT family transporter [Mesobacterium sp. TK19101]MEC3859660.1 DMT family transporter [Mesobacterium sp. TK19101]
MTAELLPPLFGLMAAMLFGINVYIQGRGLAATTGLHGAFLSVAATAGLFWLLAPFVIDWRWFATAGAAIFAATGLFFPAAGQGLQIAGVRRVGPALTAALGAFTPVFSGVIAVAFLGEVLGLQSGLGFALMVLGLMLAGLKTRNIPRGFPLWALAIPLGASFVRGIAQVFTKLGMQSVHSPFFATLLAATVSSGVLALLLRRNGQAVVRGLNRSHSWFIASGAINGLGILALNSGIARGELTIVAPMVATTPLWTLVFGITVFRTERLHLRQFLIAGMVVAGAVLLVTR